MVARGARRTLCMGPPYCQKRPQERAIACCMVIVSPPSSILTSRQVASNAKKTSGSAATTTASRGARRKKNVLVRIIRDCAHGHAHGVAFAQENDHRRIDGNFEAACSRQNVKDTVTCLGMGYSAGLCNFACQCHAGASLSRCCRDHLRLNCASLSSGLNASFRCGLRKTSNANAPNIEH
jgi:hypothetical protein